MIIPGTIIANSIKETVHKKVTSLSGTPHLAVVIVGDDPSSLTYINRKKKMGEEIGVMVSVYHLKPKELENFYTTVKILNEDEEVDGIIIQRPVPLNIRKEELDILVRPEKDVDGFHPASRFTPPIGQAILTILEWVYQQEKDKQLFSDWLNQKKILVIGRGETGGGPIIKTFHKMKIPIQNAHSKTENIKELCLSSDIIISCVGKADIVRHDMVTKKTILLGVGMHPDQTFVPDYNQEELKGCVAYYTPVPGGVGPVNVSYLLKNVVDASSHRL